MSETPHNPTNINIESSYSDQIYTGSSTDKGEQERRSSLASLGVLDDLLGRRSSLLGDLGRFTCAESQENRTGGRPFDGTSLDAFIYLLGNDASSGTLPTRRNSLELIRDPEASYHETSINRQLIESSQQRSDALAERQRLLVQQQLEIETRQKDLETRRNELIASLQLNTSQYLSSIQPTTYPVSFHLANIRRQRHSLNIPHNRNTHTCIQAPTIAIDEIQCKRWWICQVCNTGQFPTIEEAAAHENTCEGLSDTSQDHLFLRSGSDISSSNQSKNSVTQISESSSSLVKIPPSLGPFAMMDPSRPLACANDNQWLTPLHCFIRKFCVELFSASHYDSQESSSGNRKQIQIGQVGLRCPYCRSGRSTHSNRSDFGSIYYPTTISSIYNGAINLVQRHMEDCDLTPSSIFDQWKLLKLDDARCGASKQYWTLSARSIGLIDTPVGIRFSALHSVTTSEYDLTAKAPSDPKHDPVAKYHISAYRQRGIDILSTFEDSHAHVNRVDADLNLVVADDRPLSTSFSYTLMSQMKRCSFAEADNLGKRIGLPLGYPGLACCHCFGGFGSGRFFPSTLKTLSDTSKTINVLYRHVQRCRCCPDEVKTLLAVCYDTHDEERRSMKFGSQKAFFTRIWNRLHSNEQLDGCTGLSLGKRVASPVQDHISKRPKPEKNME